MIASIGYADTFFWFALGQGGVIFVLAWLLRSPQPGEVSERISRQGAAIQELEHGQMLASPVFWMLYIMFVLVSASGLMVAAQIALIAKDYGVSQTVILFGASTLIVAGVIDNLANGGARPFFGWVSDRIGPTRDSSATRPSPLTASMPPSTTQANCDASAIAIPRPARTWCS